MTAKDWRESFYLGWCSSAGAITVEYLGEATDGVAVGVVCASYNAG
jgi:hypothetical protein